MKHILMLVLLLSSFASIGQTFDTHNIGGTVLSCNGNEAPNSYTIFLKNEAGDVIQSANESPYLFENVPSGEKYTISGTASQLNPLNGVTTFDMVLISGQILGTNPFDTLCEFIAADINGSNTISTIDLVRLKRVILNIDVSFPVPDILLPASTALTLGGIYEEEITIEELSGDVLDADFTFIKIGNLNQ